MLDQKMIAQIGAACEHVSRNALKVFGSSAESRHTSDIILPRAATPTGVMKVEPRFVYRPLAVYWRA